MWLYLSAGMLIGLAGKTELAEEMDSLDPDDKHYMKRKADLADRLYRMYDTCLSELNKKNSAKP